MVPPDWLPGKLYDSRVVLLTGRLDDALATRAAGALLSLDAEGAGPIELHVDCADGTLEAAFALIDTLGRIRAPVHARCRGDVGSPAIGVVAATRHRSASPYTRFRLAQPRVGFSGSPDQVAAYARGHRDLLVQLQAHLARSTGHPVDEIADDMLRGRYLDAREALDYGLIDEVTGSAP
jgi:ATP-dependent Clp protease protease subunit